LVTDFYFTKTMGGALKPADGAAEEYLDSLGTGEIIRADCRKDRNPGHHRKFFGILQLVLKNQEKYLSLEALRFAVMVSSGYVDQIALEGDKVAFRPVSIAWSKMDQTEFDALYKASLAAIPRLLPQFDGVDLDRELSLTT
jgi:hypothetical protein